MGRKSAAKQQRPDATGPSQPEKGGGRSLMIVAMVLVAALGIYFVIGRDGSASPGANTDTTAAQNADKNPDPKDIAKNEAFAESMTALGPHEQAAYPPIPFQDFAPPRPPQTVTAAFQFAAEHPEVLSYIPCFCGCQHQGHRGNEDCFVKTRNAKGDVTEWEPHGVECAVCIDVATRARQMHASGASVTQIRAAVEKEFKANAPSMTPTPEPHAH